MRIKRILKWILIILATLVTITVIVVGAWAYDFIKMRDKDFSTEIGKSVRICDRVITSNDKEYMILSGLLSQSTDGWQKSFKYWAPHDHGGYSSNKVVVQIFPDRLHIISRRLGNWVRRGKYDMLVTKQCEPAVNKGQQRTVKSVT